MTVVANPGVVCEEGEIPALGGPKLFVRGYRPGSGMAARASVLVLHGYDDHSGRYAETCVMLAEAGYQVRSFDFRGHGRSGGARGYCRRWNEYLNDLAAARAAPGGGDDRIYIVAQSHGALVALHWALRHPGSVAGLILSATYLRLVMPVPRAKLAAARFLSRLAPAMRMKSNIRAEMLTRDLRLQRETDTDSFLSRVATPRWFTTSTAAQAEALRRAGEITTPTLVVHGGVDPIADPQAARDLFENLGSPDKTLRIYEEMRHEPFRETGREQVWAEIRAWLDERAG
jgi:alpha-beta hydrolase superfamily lysophospholipase